MNTPTLPKTHPVPNMNCPVCGTRINVASTVWGQVGFHKNNIIICAACAGVLRVGDSSLERVSREQFEALPAGYKAAIALAAVKVKEMLQKS